MSKTAEQEKNFAEGMKSYLKGVKSEWGKITWPEKQQVVSETIVVIVVVLFFTVLVYAMDTIFSLLLGLIPNR